MDCEETGIRISLRAFHLFGRHTSRVDTILDGKEISKVHATIWWNGYEWQIRDSSRNGTWLNNSRLLLNRNVSVAVGSKIVFTNKSKMTWLVVNVDPPKAQLQSLQNRNQVINLERIHAFPTTDNPSVTLYMSASGHWIYENDNCEEILNDRDLVTIEGEVWRYYSANSEMDTIEATGIRDISQLTQEPDYRFTVSLDEEHVYLSLLVDNFMVDLGERAHHYTLLILARKRIEDELAGVDKNNQGWIDISELKKMLGIDGNLLNIQIFRARKQIAESVAHLVLPPIIERRKGSIRFGSGKVTITRGSEKEVEELSLSAE